ncbi:hypothetical protein CAPTEDRAFT_197444 [Capitella teleta]|uniref:Methyltransferase domain-containing protein n=1 Tax=Capitella teleta TaxID=283909 RepID=R7T9K7_CAPTE|nr:hypothetical protein CAPTEDRAFT_197444 [Capitella teleta]|eukprot:ELT90428.1 hypothetical protein CAPTEDRAFT_197444 [Capitella teleta]
MGVKPTRRLTWILFVVLTSVLLVKQISERKKQTLCDLVARNDHTVTSGRGEYPSFTLSTVRSEHFYISENYTSRDRPSYYRDKGVLDVKYNLAAYYIIGELARRFEADYIIDIGCGTAHKLAKLQKEFKLIGIDYGANLKEAKEEHPGIQTIRIDLDSESCQLDLDQDVVRRAVVVSADVIEHLRNPLTCYLKITKSLADRAIAVVLTTPDRRQVASVLKGAFTQNLKGPPVNTAHVREWTLEEAQTMLIKQHLTPVYSGQVCGRLGSCSKGFSFADSSFTNQIHIMANIHPGVQHVPVDEQVVAFVIVTKQSSQAHLDFNVHYLLNNGIRVILLLVKTTIQHSQPAVHFDRFQDALAYIEDASAGNCIKDGDWLMVMDTNDVIRFPQSPYMVTSLGDNLFRIGQQNFNAVAITTVFMHTEQGLNNPPSKPVKFYSKGAWNKTPIHLNDDLKPIVQNTFIKIWKKDSSAPVLLQAIQTPSAIGNYRHK